MMINLKDDLLDLWFSLRSRFPGAEPVAVSRTTIRHFKKGEAYAPGVTFGSNGLMEQVKYSDGRTRTVITAREFDTNDYALICA